MLSPRALRLNMAFSLVLGAVAMAGVGSPACNGASSAAETAERSGTAGTAGAPGAGELGGTAGAAGRPVWTDPSLGGAAGHAGTASIVHGGAAGTSAGGAGGEPPFISPPFWPRPYDPTCVSQVEDLTKMLTPAVQNMPGLICMDCHDASAPNPGLPVPRVWEFAGTITRVPIPPRPGSGQAVDWADYGVEHIEVGVRVRGTELFYSACSTDYGAFFLDDLGDGATIDWANAEVRLRTADAEVIAPRGTCGAYEPSARGFCNLCHSGAKRPGAASALGYLQPPQP
jgi:hypothetical protein